MRLEIQWLSEPYAKWFWFRRVGGYDDGFGRMVRGRSLRIGRLYLMLCWVK